MVANIQGIDQEYKPWGGLAGVATGERRALTDFANQQALQQANLENVLKEVEARRAQADYNNPDMELWRQQGIMGKNKEAFSQGELSYQTLDSNVKTKLAENLSKASSAEIESTLNGLQTFVIEASSGQGGLGMQQALSKFPPHIQQVVQKLEAQQPGSSITYAKQLLDVMKNTLADTPKFRSDVSLENVRAENSYIKDTDVADINAASHKYTADKHLEGVGITAAASREAKSSADKRVEEDQITRRINAINNLVKENTVEISKLNEELSQVELISLSHLPASKRQAARAEMKKERTDRIAALRSANQDLKEKEKELNGLSKFSNKATQGTAENPIILK